MLQARAAGKARVCRPHSLQRCPSAAFVRCQLGGASDAPLLTWPRPLPLFPPPWLLLPRNQTPLPTPPRVRARATQTLYTLTGSMNKFIVAFVGIWLFNESRDPRYVASIAVGLAAGGLLPFVKVGAARALSRGLAGRGPSGGARS